MAASLYTLTVPAFERSLNALLAVLAKAGAHAEARKFDANNYVGLRLAPDQFSLVRQVQSTCDHAKNTVYRLAGQEPPRVEDKETTFAELSARIEMTLSLLKSVDKAAIDAGAEREIAFPIGPSRKVKMPGPSYLANFALPNFYFHLTTAFDILRAAGVEIGKRDFIGNPPDVVAV
jgi:uncharacterized protein